MKIHKVTNIEQFVAKITPKQAQKNKSIVESILKNVQKNGDSAVKKYERKFTGASISTLRISKVEIKNAYSKVSKNEITALRLAKSRVEKTESAIKSIFNFSPASKTLTLTLGRPIFASSVKAFAIALVFFPVLRLT